MEITSLLQCSLNVGPTPALQTKLFLEETKVTKCSDSACSDNFSMELVKNAVMISSVAQDSLKLVPIEKNFKPQPCAKLRAVKQTPEIPQRAPQATLDPGGDIPSERRFVTRHFCELALDASPWP